jgi:hypothetical protein
LENKKKDNWDKASVILQPVGGLLAALAVAGLGFFGSQYLERRQTIDTNTRLYSELMSKREEADSALRKDMFKSIIDSFLSSKTQGLEEKVLNLELLAYNFHETLNLEPLFTYLRKRIVISNDPSKKEYSERLDRVAREITRKQMQVLENAGQKFDRSIDLNTLRENPNGIPLKEASMTLDGVERYFRIFVQEANEERKEIKLRLEIRRPKGVTGEMETNSAEFWVGFFSFPMIHNTRLSNNQRCAIALTAFEPSSADITAVYFPGSYASLKEKPDYQEVIQNLVDTSGVFNAGKKK